jgi:hypothetical protein
MHDFWTERTISYTSLWDEENFPFTGKVRVMSLAYPLNSPPASTSTRSLGLTKNRYKLPQETQKWQLPKLCLTCPWRNWRLGSLRHYSVHEQIQVYLRRGCSTKSSCFPTQKYSEMFGHVWKKSSFSRRYGIWSQDTQTLGSLEPKNHLKLSLQLILLELWKEHGEQDGTLTKNASTVW